MRCKLNPLQVELAEKLGKLSGCNDYSLFLCSSGAEAENAQMASFTPKARVVSFHNAFTAYSAAVATTDNPKIVAPMNAQQVVTLPLNDIDGAELKKRRCCLRNYRTNSRCGLDQGTTEFFKH
jgi:acetylornithine aminotransferase